jgi:hypothetical protein
MTDIVAGLTALIKNTEGRLYDHERKFLDTAVLHIQGMRALTGKAEAGPTFRSITADIPRRSDEPKSFIRAPMSPEHEKETTDEAH